MGAQNRTPLPLVRYRLARAALDLHSFTVSELATMAAVPANTVYSFLSELGPSVTQESLPAPTPGRPRKIYTLTKQAVETLLAGNFEVARVLRQAGIELPQEPAAVEVETAQEVEVYVKQLKDLCNTQKQILQALRMSRRAQTEPLREAFENRVHITEEQLRHLDRIFDDLGRFV